MSEFKIMNPLLLNKVVIINQHYIQKYSVYSYYLKVLYNRL